MQRGGIVGKTLMAAALGHRRLLFAVAAAAALGAIAVPVTAFVIVPLFVRSTVHQAAPGEQPASSGGTAATAAPAAGLATDTKILATGDLRTINAVDFGRGKVLIVQVGDQRFLRFENVEIAGAPAQRIYLSDRIDGKPGNFVDLGDLKATNGSFNYSIPAGLDLGKFKAVVSYCRQFNVAITYAVLQFA